jgi:hypothetical protein
VELELEMLENIFLDEGVVEEHAKVSTKHPDLVTCVLKLQPNTGFDHNKVAVVFKVLLSFSQEVRESTQLIHIHSTLIKHQRWNSSSLKA